MYTNKREEYTSMLFGDCILANVCFRRSCSVFEIVSRSWSGTTRIDTRAVTEDGMTVESVEMPLSGLR